MAVAGKFLFLFAFALVRVIVILQNKNLATPFCSNNVQFNSKG
jgi:hypothetical protein